MPPAMPTLVKNGVALLASPSQAAASVAPTFGSTLVAVRPTRPLLNVGNRRAISAAATSPKLPCAAPPVAYGSQEPHFCVASRYFDVPNIRIAPIVPEPYGKCLPLPPVNQLAPPSR